MIAKVATIISVFCISCAPFTICNIKNFVNEQVDEKIACHNYYISVESLLKLGQYKQ